MVLDARADAQRLEAIRQANRRRPVVLADAFDLTPSIRRVILREIAPLEDGPLRPADWIKLHVPFSGRGRKHGRAYTIRQRVGDHIVIDMAMHGGLCASWAHTARAGDRAEISGTRSGFKLAWPPTGHVLLGGDETGLPAIAGILAGLPRETRGTAWLEVPTEDDIQSLEAPRGVTVRFLPRKGAAYGKLLGEAMRQVPVPPAAKVWVAAERAAALDLREHFEAVLPREQVRTAGYWRLPCSDGRQPPEDLEDA